MLTKMKTALDGGGRVTILVRHAERPALEPGDRTFGASLPLTANGWRDAQNFGIMLARELRPKSVAFYAGGTFRTLQTACGMAMGLDLAEAGARIERKVRLVDFLGSESPFFGSVEERMSLAAQGHYHERLNDYFRNGVQRGYKDAAIIVKTPDGVQTTDFQSSRSSLTLAPVRKSPSHHRN